MNANNNKMDTSLQVTMVGVTKDIEYIKRDIADIKLGIDKVSNAFVSKQEFTDIVKVIEKRLTEVEAKKSLWRYLNPILSAVISSAVTFLLISYIQNRGGVI